MYSLLENHAYLRDYSTKSLKTLQLNASQHTKIKQNQFSLNNPEDKHDIPITIVNIETSPLSINYAITYNNLYMTLRHSLSHLHLKQI